MQFNINVKINSVVKLKETVEIIKNIKNENKNDVVFAEIEVDDYRINSNMNKVQRMIANARK